jgi:hypothetical protein
MQTLFRLLVFRQMARQFRMGFAGFHFRYRTVLLAIMLCWLMLTKSTAMFAK